MKAIQSLAVALALFVTHAPAQRPISPTDLRSHTERAEDQRLEMLRLQRETNEELRRQTEEAAHRAIFDKLERDTAAARERKEARADVQSGERIQRRAMQEPEPAVPPAHLLPTEQEVIDAEQVIAKIRADTTLSKTMQEYRVNLAILKLTKPGTSARPPLTEANVIYAGALLRGIVSAGGERDEALNKFVVGIRACLYLREDVEALMYRSLGVAQPKPAP